MKKRNPRYLLRVGAALLVVATMATGCKSATNTASDTSGNSSNGKTITFGVIPGWTDETGTTALIENILEAKGYTVNVKQISDNAPMYTALSTGAIDVLTSSWLEKTHKTYWATYGSKLEDIGIYYKNATSFLAVPDYSNVKSIADLPANAGEFGGHIVGIEPGAGLTELTQKSVIPAYGLDPSMKLLTSSTAAMLTELKKAIAAKQEIVVTMWKPFWANGAFPIRPLEDPKGAYGAPENLHVIARGGFSTDHPEVANMLKHFTLTDAQYNSLENLVANKYGQGHEQEAAAEWAKENPTYVPALEKYLTP